MVGNIYDICRKEEAVQVAGEERKPAELFSHFLREILKFLGIQDIVKIQNVYVLLRRNLMRCRYGITRKPAAWLVFRKKIHAHGLRGELLLLCTGTEKRNLEPERRMVCVFGRYG